MPAPLVPAEVDLRDFEFMPLDVNRLRDSKFTKTAKPEEFRAGVLLWCAAWHQVPAGSLPDDDVELASLAGYGYGIKDWRRVKQGALYGWMKADDGRLYHDVLAEKALESWDSKLKHAYWKYADRMRKENKRRKAENLPELGIPEFEEWKSSGKQGGIPPENADSSAGIPPEKALKVIELKRSGTEELQNRDVGVNPPPTPADLSTTTPNDNVATGKSTRSTPNNGASGQRWGQPAYVKATANTLGIQRREGELDDDFRDRVYSAVQQRQVDAKRRHP